MVRFAKPQALWNTQHKVDYSLAFDGDSDGSDGILGSFFDGAAIPFNMIIDARSMEILSTEIGFDRSLDAEIKSWVAWEGTHPPK